MIDENSEPERQIVPVRQQVGARPPQATQGMLWVILGGVISSFFSYLGIFLVAYGMRELLEAKRVQGLGIGLVACVGLSVAAWFYDVSFALELIPGLVCAAGISWFMWRKQAGVTAVSAVIVVACAVSLALDATYFASSGYSIGTVVQTALETSVRAAVGSDIQANLLISQVMPIIRTIWPFAYAMSAMFDALAASVGSYAMSVRCTGVSRVPQIANFDAPMWCVGALALCILGLGASFAGIPEAEMVRTVCVTCLASLRVIFALQGFGVVSALTSRKRLGCATRFLITFATVWLEAMCFAMCIVGLIDIWANFRKLSRDGANTQEAKQ